MCALMVPALTYLIPMVVGLCVQWVSIEQFKADRSAFVADPQGFPMLRKLAREQYGVEVVLGDAEQSWASTTVNLPNASVASMALRPGYCHLSLHRANVLRGFEPVGQVDPALWVQGVMLHEFAHCLDGARDTQPSASVPLVLVRLPLLMPLASRTLRACLRQAHGPPPSSGVRLWPTSWPLASGSWLHLVRPPAWWPAFAKSVLVTNKTPRTQHVLDRLRGSSCAAVLDGWPVRLGRQAFEARPAQARASWPRIAN